MREAAPSRRRAPDRQLSEPELTVHVDPQAVYTDRDVVRLLNQARGQWGLAEISLKAVQGYFREFDLEGNPVLKGRLLARVWTTTGQSLLDFLGGQG